MTEYAFHISLHSGGIMLRRKDGKTCKATDKFLITKALANAHTQVSIAALIEGLPKRETPLPGPGELIGACLHTYPVLCARADAKPSYGPCIYCGEPHAG